MEYELKDLEQMIMVELNPKKLIVGTHSRDFFRDCMMQVGKQAVRVRQQMTDAAISLESDSRIAMYFRQHQYGLTRLADTIFEYQQMNTVTRLYKSGNKPSLKELYFKLAETIASNLQYMKERFSIYFDLNAKITDEQKLILTKEIKGNLKLIEARLRSLGIADALIEICCNAIMETTELLNGINYNDCAYLHLLQKGLLNFSTAGKINNANEDLCSYLISINFNDIRFFNFYILQLKDNCKACTTAIDIIEFHSLKLKLINQLPITPGLAFKPALPNIKEQIGSWICEELYFIEKREALRLSTTDVDGKPLPKEAKVHTSLSVAHLSLAVKLLIDARLITNKNSSELMRMVARNFRTDRREEISEDSLRNKSYNFESGTVEKMKDVIIGLINLVRRY